jgi:hypothetical protein
VVDIHGAETLNVLACAKARALVCSGFELCIRELDTGYLVFAGTQTPLTCAISVGNSGPLDRRELARMSKFFLERGAAPAIHVRTDRTPAFSHQLLSEGYSPDEAMSVVVADLATMKTANDARIPIEEVRRLHRREWIRVVSSGWANCRHVGRSDEEAGAVIAAIPTVRLFLARGRDGQALGGAAMIEHDGVCIFFGDSTLPQARRLGVQSALILHRAAEARKTAQLASALTIPDGVSERNYIRAGFQFSHYQYVFRKSTAARRARPGRAR